MNKLYFVFLLTLSHLAFSQGVGINEDGSAPHGSAILDVKSTDKGLLLPRLTNTQRDNINNPAAGLYIFNSTSGKMNYYNGDFWVQIPQTNCPYKILSPLKDLSNPSGTYDFSVVEVSGITDYQWTVPQGWTINSGQGTNSISVDINTITNGESVGLSMLVNDVEQCYTQYQFSKSVISGGNKTIRVSDGSFGTIGATYEVCVFNYLGTNDTLSVIGDPVDGKIEVYMWGAGGGFGTYSAGSGGFSKGSINVSASDQFVVRTGGAGFYVPGSSAPVALTAGPFPGGGGCYGIAGTGGGYSGIFDLSLNPLIIAGGGGGGAYNTTGGSGGGTTGIAGTDYNSSATGGGGGTQAAGGAAGTGTNASGTVNPIAGAAFQGGNGGRYSNDQFFNGGGGGGGYFGGGGGFGYYGAGGGGGSGFIAGSVNAGTTSSNAGVTPPMATHSLYPIGVAVGGSSQTNDGGNGVVVVVARIE